MARSRVLSFYGSAVLSLLMTLAIGNYHQRVESKHR